jgi:hypothetical protein
MGGRRTRVACGGSGTEMYFGDSGGIRAEERRGAWDWEVLEVVLKLFRRPVVAVLDVVEAEVRPARPHTDGRGICGGILTA